MDFARVKGRVHSCESFGAVDGPGIRYVLFLQGCALHCNFCHNPDTWDFKGGKETAAGDVVREILTYKTYIQRGGVTLSGGEPLLQPDFCEAVIRLCKQYGLHTAIDTAGAVPLSVCKKAVDAADLLLLDFKGGDDDVFRAITREENRPGTDASNTRALLAYCEEQQKPVWIRHVLVPGFTLQEDKLKALAAYLKGFACVQKAALLPFHKMGEYKWKELSLPYQLSDTPEPTPEEVEKANAIFREAGF